MLVSRCRSFLWFYNFGFTSQAEKRTLIRFKLQSARLVFRLSYSSKQVSSLHQGFVTSMELIHWVSAQACRHVHRVWHAINTKRFEF